MKNLFGELPAARTVERLTRLNDRLRVSQFVWRSAMRKKEVAMKKITNGKFKVERGIALPARRRGPGALSKYPFAKMHVGDSFAFSKEMCDLIARSAYAHGRAYKKKFAVRLAADGRTNRCWRVE